MEKKSNLQVTNHVLSKVRRMSNVILILFEKIPIFVRHITGKCGSYLCILINKMNHDKVSVIFQGAKLS